MTPKSVKGSILFTFIIIPLLIYGTYRLLEKKQQAPFEKDTNVTSHNESPPLRKTKESVIEPREDQSGAESGPFGKPEIEAYGPDIHTDQGLWKIPGSVKQHKEDYKIRKELQDSKAEFFNRLKIR